MYCSNYRNGVLLLKERRLKKEGKAMRQNQHDENLLVVVAVEEYARRHAEYPRMKLWGFFLNTALQIQHGNVMDRKRRIYC